MPVIVTWAVASDILCGRRGEREEPAAREARDDRDDHAETERLLPAGNDAKLV